MNEQLEELGRKIEAVDNHQRMNGTRLAKIEGELRSLSGMVQQMFAAVMQKSSGYAG